MNMDHIMENQIETSVELVQDQGDFRSLLETEILLIAGGEAIVGFY